MWHARDATTNTQPLGWREPSFLGYLHGNMEPLSCFNNVKTFINLLESVFKV